jgi:hypothetical protein
MKELLRKLVNATGFDKSKLYFFIQYNRQIRSLKPDLNHPEHREVLEELDREGIAVIPGFFSKEDCDRILAELDGIYDQVKAGTFGGKFQYNHEKLIRTIETDTVAETTKQFFQHPVLDQIAKAYIDPKAYAYRRESELRDTVNEVQQADTYHFDDWRMRFKFFLYLTDVEQENAPFTYLTRTHKSFKGRRKKDLEYERDGETGAYGHFHPQEVREVRRHLDCAEKVCIAKAGTLIIADFRGLHKGTPLKSGRRVLLNATYGI